MDSSSKPDTVPPTSQPPPAATNTKLSTPTVPFSTQNVQNPPLPTVQPTVALPHPPKEPPTSEATKPSPTRPTSTAAVALNTTNKPQSQEQDGKVTTSVTTTVPSSLAPASQSGPQVTVSQNQLPPTQAQPAVPTSSSTNAPTTQPPTSSAESRASSIPSNTVTGVKRPSPEADSGPPTQHSTDSENVSKRKKVRKEKEPGKAQATAENKETGSSGQDTGEAKSDSSSITGTAASPKVPPIKIVLQSHGPSSGGSGSNGAGTESDSANSSSHAHHHSANGSGFPYVVSSTTPDTTTTTSSLASVPAPSRIEGSTSGQDKKESGTAALVSNEQTKQTSVSQISSATNQAKIISSVVPSASTTSSPASSTAHTVSTQSSQASAEPVMSSETRKDPVVKLDVMSSIPTAISASAAKEASKETSPPVTTAPSSIPVTSSAVSVPVTSAASTIAGGASEESGTVPTSTVTTTNETTTPTAKTSKDKPQRVTRSSQRIATNTGGVTSHIFTLGTPHSPGGGSPKPSNSNSACPSPNHMEPMDVGTSVNQSKVDSVVGEAAVELGSKKRKVKGKDKDKEPSAPSSSSSSTSGDPGEAAQGVPAVNPNDPPLQNCVEMFLNIRKQIERRRRNLFPVQPKPPQGFKDYLMNRGSYVLASNSNAQLAVSTHTPPNSLPPQCKEMFIEQEKERHKLRIQQVVEKEKLVLSVEQEILRVHGRAARALSNQALPFSVCTILKDLEVYNLLTPEQEEKDRNARSRYNGRLFLSWLQDVDDKWDKIKEAMLLRHHNEAESLHAVQKMDWEWKLKEVGLCEPKANPQIDEIHVPMVNVSDDFDLLPA